MPVFSRVYPWPVVGRADQPTDDDEVVDVAVRGCRSVAELYSHALLGLRLPHPVSGLRLFVRHDPGLDDVRATVQLDRAGAGFEMAHVFLPTAFVARSADARARVLLEAVDGLVRRLAVARGWDVAAIDACREHVLSQGMEYRWSSPPKASPDRRHEAYAHFRLTPDGYGRVRVHVAERDGGAVVGSSDEAVAFCTHEGFRRAASLLRWHSTDHVAMVPYDWVPAVRGGRVSVVRGPGGTWEGAVVDYTTVRPTPDGDPTLPPLAVRVEGRGAAATEQPAEMTFIGGGPIESPQIESFHDAFAAEMRGFASPPGQAWWRGAGVRLPEVVIFYEAGEDRVRGRLSGQRLRVGVDRSGARPPEADLGVLAREAVAEVVALVRRRTGLGPHPVLESLDDRPPATDPRSVP